MSHAALNPQQFSGVLHGMDELGSTVTAPYEGLSRDELTGYVKRIESQSGYRISEASHPGSCDEAGCKF